LIERRQEAAAADGKLLWQVASHPQGRFFNSATPIVDGQTVIYTGQGKGTKAVKIEKQGEGFAAKELWSNADLGTGFNTPVLKDGMLFGFSDKGNLFCLNAKTGQAAWTDPTRRGGNFAAILDAGSSLLALPSNSELIALKPGDKQYEEMAKYHLVAMHRPEECQQHGVKFMLTPSVGEDVLKQIGQGDPKRA
jgi:outer membrane protein assembly factor BamB